MIFTNTFVIIYCIGFAFSFIANLGLHTIQYRFRKKHATEIPAIFASSVTREKLSLTNKYKNEQFFLFLFQFIAVNVSSFLLLAFGFYSFAFYKLQNVFQNYYFHVFAFAFFASLPLSIIALPFSLYDEFVIEKKYGFSNMTFQLWISDALKSFVLSAILAIILLSAIIFSLQTFSLWFFIFGTIYLLFSLLVSFLYPNCIAPLFNKFTPLEDGELKNKITNLMQTSGFRASGIFVSDASKRSAHSNAYFTGFGKTKRVVLFDTLLKQLSTDELCAVIAHELGHFKKHHIIKRMIASFALVYILLFSVSKFILVPNLYEGFFFHFQNANPALLFVGIFLCFEIAQGFSLFVSMASNVFSRHDEYEADAYAKKICGTGEFLSSALIKLNTENKSDLHIAKIFSFAFYSHPTVSERVEKLQ